MFKEINFPLPGEFLRLLMRGEANVKKKKNEGQDDHGLDIHTFLWRLSEPLHCLVITTSITPPNGMSKTRRTSDGEGLSVEDRATSQGCRSNFWTYSSGGIVSQTFTQHVCSELQLPLLIVALLQSRCCTEVATLTGHFRNPLEICSELVFHRWYRTIKTTVLRNLSEASLCS